eukprot:COSAG04_NODE_515_length_13209_cov_19.059115_2_plen_213_part_00
MSASPPPSPHQRRAPPVSTLRSPRLLPTRAPRAPTLPRTASNQPEPAAAVPPGSPCVSPATGCPRHLSTRSSDATVAFNSRRPGAQRRCPARPGRRRRAAAPRPRPHPPQRSQGTGLRCSRSACRRICSPPARALGTPRPQQPACAASKQRRPRSCRPRLRSKLRRNQRCRRRKRSHRSGGTCLRTAGRRPLRCRWRSLRRASAARQVRIFD